MKITVLNKMKLTDTFWKLYELDLQEAKISYLNWAIGYAREPRQEFWHLFLWDHQEEFCIVNSRYGRSFAISPFGLGVRGVPRLRYEGNMMNHLSEYINWKRLMEESTEPEDFVLISSHRKPYSTRALQYAFKKCLKEAELPVFYSIHSCRHTYGTLLYHKTKNLRLVQKQLGHSSIQYVDQDTVDLEESYLKEDSDSYKDYLLCH